MIVMKRFLSAFLIFWLYLTFPAYRALAEGNSSHPTPEETYYEELKKEYVPQKRPEDRPGQITFCDLKISSL